jgi:pimeloyl-ACP methyl ester carboxylesterase
MPSCDSVQKIRRDATRIQGMCYSGNADIPFDPYDYITYSWDFSIPPQPIVFIHGFLGSEIKCGGDELWPNIPPKPNLLGMALDIDGVSPASGACAATVDGIVKSVPGKQIYGPTVDFLNQLYAQEPGSVYFFNWDWRTGPQQSLAKLDAKIEEIRAAHENSKVVIMAHSYGGLLARLYVDDAGRADKVARVLTVGTPAWGAPKALFPLYGGIEEPDAPFLSLGLFLNEDDLWEFSRNLLGEYFLYPSESYGPWLTIDPTSSTPVDRQGLQNYVLQLGGNPALLGQALNLHASTLDARYVPGPGDPKFEVIVGTGLPTITAVQVLPGGYLAIVYDNGDGTVPGKSAARGPMGAANPNKSRTHYSCHVGHVDLPGNSQITDAVKDYLKYGDEIEGLESPCSGSGFQIREFRLPHIASAASGSNSESASAQGAGGALPIGDAVQQGLADYLDFENERFVITGAEFPEIALPQATFLEVTPLLDGAKGQPVLYGPLEGQITISAGAGGPVVLVDGQPAPLHGDVNCDGDVTSLDPLLLLLHAGGAPESPADGCAAIGSGAEPFGDIDCDGSITAMDGLADLRMVAGAPLSFVASCQ